ncbi:MAG: hypothetical protein IJ638_02295 [Alphaproteobacteria bacterium]|nr:hypothetical protein [Alphaproteobacteria bacterium]
MKDRKEQICLDKIDESGGGEPLKNIGKILVLSIFLITISISFDTFASRKNSSGKTQSTTRSSKRSASSKKSSQSSKSKSKSSKRSASSKKSTITAKSSKRSASSQKKASSKRSASSKKSVSKTKSSKRSGSSQKQAKKSTTKNQTSKTSKVKEEIEKDNYDTDDSETEYEEDEDNEDFYDEEDDEEYDSSGKKSATAVAKSVVTATTSVQQTTTTEEKKEETQPSTTTTTTESSKEEKTESASANQSETKKETVEISDAEKNKYINVKEKVSFRKMTVDKPEAGKSYPTRTGELVLNVGCYSVTISGSAGSPSNNCKSQWGTLGSLGEDVTVYFCVKSGSATLTYKLGQTAEYAKGQCASGNSGWSSSFVVNGTLDEKYSAIKSGEQVIARGGNGGPASFHDKQKDDDDEYFIADRISCAKSHSFEISDEYGFGFKKNSLLAKLTKDTSGLNSRYLYHCNVNGVSSGKYADKVSNENNNYEDNGGYIFVDTEIPTVAMY